MGEERTEEGEVGRSGEGGGRGIGVRGAVRGVDGGLAGGRDIVRQRSYYRRLAASCIELDEMQVI